MSVFGFSSNTVLQLPLERSRCKDLKVIGPISCTQDLAGISSAKLLIGVSIVSAAIGKSPRGLSTPSMVPALQQAICLALCLVNYVIYVSKLFVNFVEFLILGTKLISKFIGFVSCA